VFGSRDAQEEVAAPDTMAEQKPAISGNPACGLENRQNNIR